MNDQRPEQNPAIKAVRISSVAHAADEVTLHPLPRWKKSEPIAQAIRRFFQPDGGWFFAFIKGNQSMKKRQKTKLLGIISMAIGITVNAAQAATQVSVTVVNQTTDIATFGYENFFGSLSEQPGEIDPGKSRTFILSSGSNLASGMRFTYMAGSKKCRFTASHTAKPLMSGAIPSWKKDAESIGGARASCTAALTSTSGADPFNYSVQFTIR